MMKTRKPTPLFPKPKAQSPKPNLNPLSLALAAATVIALAIGAIHAFRNLGLWLVVSDPEPERLDVIFTFGGGRQYRVRYSRELYLRHPGAVWIVSGREEVKHLRRMAASGLDTTRVVRVESCQSTRDEMVWLREWLTTHQPTDSTHFVGLVSSPYHMRRVNMLARTLLGEYQKHSLPVPFDRACAPLVAYESWWRHGELARLVSMEALKLAVTACQP